MFISLTATPPTLCLLCSGDGWKDSGAISSPQIVSHDIVHLREIGRQFGISCSPAHGSQNLKKKFRTVAQTLIPSKLVHCYWDQNFLYFDQVESRNMFMGVVQSSELQMGPKNRMNMPYLVAEILKGTENGSQLSSALRQVVENYSRKSKRYDSSYWNSKLKSHVSIVSDSIVR